MKHLRPFTDKGLTVILVDADHFKIQGLSSLPGALRDQVIIYAKDFKQQILSEIRIQAGIIQKGVDAMFCPAKCKDSGYCYGLSYFAGKPGKGQLCDPDQCLYKNQITAFNN